MRIWRESYLKNKTVKKVSKTMERISSPVRWIWPRLADATLGIFALIMVLFCLFTYYPDLARRASEMVSSNKYVALMDGLFNPFRNKHMLLKSGLPIYDLKIKRQEFAKIEQAIEKAKVKGWMSDDLKVWARAQFIHAGRQYNVKIRVRGDLSPHWEGPKKSWRVKFGKQAFEHEGETIEEPVYFQGKRQINLIIPKDRDYTLAHFVNSLMRDAGLVVPRDDFVILRINGVIHGLYYEVEHFDKPLLAAQKRPETTVFGQSDRAMHFEKYTKLGIPIASDAKFDLGSIRRGVDREGQLAMRAMQVMLDHSLDPTRANFDRLRNVVNWEKYLQFRVITTLCNTNHVRFGSDNLRLYFDPSRGQLEPIPWDVHIVKMPKEPGTIDFWNNHGPDEIQRATLEDPLLRFERNKVLWQYIKDGGKDLLKRFDETHDLIRPLAWADVLNTPIQGHKMDLLRKDLKYNVNRVHRVMALSSANMTYKLESENLATLELLATNFSGIKIKEIQLSDSLNFSGSYQLFEDSNDNRRLDEGDRIIGTPVESTESRSLSFVLDRYLFPEVNYDNDIIQGRYWEFYDTLAGRLRLFLVGTLASPDRDPIVWTPPQISVTAENAVSGQKMGSGFLSQTEQSPENYVGITALDASDPFDLDAPNYDLAQFLANNPMFTASQEYSGAAELSGDVTITNTVIVPRSVMLNLQPGTRITMLPRANVLSYGGLRAIGTAEKPIAILAADLERPFGTFAAVAPPEPVVLRHVVVQGGGQAKINSILFTGGFAVYDGDLDLAFCQFKDMLSEDGLNLKNGKITMDNCLFANNASDGIDIDFGTGTVTNSRFVDIRGDGLDLSGSVIAVSNTWFENITDKGISVGENSHPTIFNTLFKNCNIGLSAKDLSLARVAQSTFIDNRQAIEAKRKKPFFGGGSGEFINCVFSGNDVVLKEDVFSAGHVSVLYSIVDQPVDWSTCMTAVAPFESVADQDYSVSGLSMPRDDIRTVKAAWTEAFSNGHRSDVPGVLPGLARAYQGN